MKLEKEKIKRILFISLSNIGDIVLTTPAIYILKREFPGARLDVMVGPNGKEFFHNDAGIFKLIIYDKKDPITHKKRLVSKLRRIKYDLVVDLRNTLFPILLGSKIYTSPIHKAPQHILHKKDVHLWKLKALGINTEGAKFYLNSSIEDAAYIDNFLKKIGIDGNIVVISPGSKSNIKRWSKQGFAELNDRLVEELKVNVIMAGDSNDNNFINDISSLSKYKIINLAGRTNLRELVSLIKRSKLIITNDSAPLHIASAMNTKTIALFGPTDPRKYGPLASGSLVIKKDLVCAPCEDPQCRYNHECMRLITTDEVFEAAKKILER